MSKYFFHAMLGIAAVAVSACSMMDAKPDQRLVDAGYRDILNHDYASAQPKLEEAVQRNPGNAMAHLDLGVVYQNTGNPAGAKEQYQQAISADSSGMLVGAGTTSTSDGSTGSIGELAKRNLQAMH